MPKSATRVNLPLELAECAKKYLWVREEGNNRGVMVDRFATAINSSVAHAWCAAFVCYVVKEIEERFSTKSGLSKSEHVLHMWNHNEPIRSRYPQPGDIAIWRLKGTTSGHCGIVTDVDEKNETFKCVEGNTSSAEGDIEREGQGVYWKERPNKPDMGKFRLLGFLRPF